MAGEDLRAFRGSILHFLRDPGGEGDASAWEYFADGLLIVTGGRVERVGPAEPLLRELPKELAITDYTGRLILPGFIDTHVHYSQTDIIASCSAELLAWLDDYAFPAERRFEEVAHAREVAWFFTTELLRNGTTTAAVFGTVHPQSVDAFFETANSRNMRMIAGKVLMDRNCPEWLRDTAETGIEASRALAEKWHGNGRLSYAVTPRFAPTSTEAQLTEAGRLFRDNPSLYMQTHVAENEAELKWVAELFPGHRSYLDVYDYFGLVGERSVFAHCIWLDETDRKRMADSGAAASFCPSSNLFLGSGLFDYKVARESGVRVGLGSDIGAGTSFNMLKSMADAYKVSQLAGHVLDPMRAFYLATLGGAESLYLDDRIGNFTKGKEADFVVLEFDSTPLQSRRNETTQNLNEKLFALMMLGDDRAIAATHILGAPVHIRA